MGKPIFIAHRGGWMSGRRENTIAALERAANSGRFAYIEMDIRRTRSDDQGTQTPILIHDDTLDRLYDLYSIPKYKRHRLGQKVSGLSIDIIRSEEIELATLAEAMRAIKGHPIVLDIKESDALVAVFDVLHDMFAKYEEWAPEKIVITSFDWSILQDAKQRDPNVGVALLLSWRNLQHIFNMGRTYHSIAARWVAINSQIALPVALMARLYDIPNRYTYTINHPILVKIFMFFGLNGITTDKITLPDEIGPKSQNP